MTSWIANVYEQGFLHLNITRAARVPWVFPLWLCNEQGLGFDTRLTLSWSPITGQLQTGLMTVPRPDLPFPYGVTVEPP